MSPLQECYIVKRFFILFLFSVALFVDVIYYMCSHSIQTNMHGQFAYLLLIFFLFFGPAQVKLIVVEFNYGILI